LIANAARGATTNLNRLTQATVSAKIAPVKTFTYGPIGNPLSKSDVGTYTYPLGGAALPHAGSVINGTIIRRTPATLDGVLELEWGGLRGQVHAAVVVLGKRSPGETGGPKELALRLRPMRLQKGAKSAKGEVAASVLRRP
jgi:hypothetical protein